MAAGRRRDARSCCAAAVAAAEAARPRARASTCWSTPTTASSPVREGETLLDAGLREGVPLPFDCRNGGCGVCKVHAAARRGGLRRLPGARAHRGRARGGQACSPACAKPRCPTSRSSTCRTAPRRSRSRRAPGAPRVSRDGPARARRDARAPRGRGRRAHRRSTPASTSTSCSTTARSAASPSPPRRTSPTSSSCTSAASRAGASRRTCSTTMKVGRPACASRGPLGSFFLREDGDKPDHLRRRRHRLRAGEEHARVRLPRRHEAPDAPLLGRARARATCTSRELPERWAHEHANFTLRAGALRSRARGPLDRAAPGLVHEAILADFPDLAGLPDLRLRLGEDGRGGAAGVRDARARAGRLLLRRVQARRPHPCAGADLVRLEAAREPRPALSAAQVAPLRPLDGDPRLLLDRRPPSSRCRPGHALIRVSLNHAAQRKVACRERIARGARQARPQHARRARTARASARRCS